MNEPEVKVLMLKGEKGDSAYQVAVKNGYTDSEKVWADSFLSADYYYNKTETETKLRTKPYVFSTLADLKKYDLKVGEYAETTGYYAPNDGGFGLYEITDDSALIADGGLIHNLSNGLKAKLINTDSINIKQYGAKGDGEFDNTEIFKKVVSKFTTIFIPEGDYKVTETIELPDDTYIFSNKLIKTWSGKGKSAKLISPDETYFFRCKWGNVNKFENLTFSGYGIDEPCGTQIINCEFMGKVGINNARVSDISLCSFHDCEIAGLTKATDCKIHNNFIWSNKGIGIDLSYSNSNSVTDNKIEWNGTGIKIYKSNYNSIIGNVFDRQTTYAIDGKNITSTMIMSNRFMRNLVMHIKIDGGMTVSIINNILLTTNSEDLPANSKDLTANSEDGSTGKLVPTVAMSVPSISNSVIKNNQIELGRGGKWFNKFPDYYANLTIEGNTLNGHNTDKYSVDLGILKTSTTKTVVLRKQWREIKYLGTNGYDCTLRGIRLESESGTYNMLNNLEAYKHSNNGIYVAVTNDSSDRSFHCYADMEITNKFSIVNI